MNSLTVGPSASVEVAVAGWGAAPEDNHSAMARFYATRLSGELYLPR